MESTSVWIVRRDISAAHHEFSRTKHHIRCSAIHAPRTHCLICRRSTGPTDHAIAYELCMAVGSASLYCTISKRWFCPFRLSGREGRTQAAPADDDARDGEQKAKGAEPDDQAVAQQRGRDESRKIQRLQRAVEPAIGPPRWIQPLQQIAVGAVDVEPEVTAIRAVDRGARDSGPRGIVVVLGKYRRTPAAGRQARGQPLDLVHIQRSRRSIAGRVPCLDQGLTGKARSIPPIESAVEGKPFDFTGRWRYRLPIERWGRRPVR